MTRQAKIIALEEHFTSPKLRALRDIHPTPPHPALQEVYFKQENC